VFVWAKERILQPCWAPPLLKQPTYRPVSGRLQDGVTLHPPIKNIWYFSAPLGRELFRRTQSPTRFILFPMYVKAILILSYRMFSHIHAFCSLLLSVLIGLQAFRSAYFLFFACFFYVGFEFGRSH
jgi:hypothetical protein